MTKIGILGGAFDPPHEGHLRLAREAMQIAALDRVLLVPCGTPPHRKTEASARDRMTMTKLSVEGETGVSASEAEMRQGVAYAADTLRELKKANPDAQFFYILGADKLSTLTEWHDTEALFSLCEFLACPRGDIDIAAASALARSRGAQIHPITVGWMDVSSGVARAKIRAFSDAQGVLTESVAEYIALRGLYQRDFAAEMKRELPEKRYKHVLSVRDTAVRMARRFGESMQKAAVAALLHDCAKALPMPEMRALAGYSATPALLHGPAGAVLAREKYGVSDPEILSAIRLHTTGAAGMTALDAIIYLADAIEPTREAYPDLDEIRAAAQTDLWRACLLSMERTVAYVGRSGFRLDPKTVDAMAWVQRKCFT